MAMEFEVGSLANLISGTKSSAGPKKKTLFKTKPPVKEVAKFETTTLSTETKWAVVSTDSNWEVEEIKERKADRVVESGDPGSNLTVQNKYEKRKDRTRFSNDVFPKVHHKKENQLAQNDSAKERVIFVGNVPYNRPNNIIETELKNLFSKYGRVERVNVIRSPYNMKVLIRFEEVDSAKKAIAANGIFYNGNDLRVNLDQRPEYDFRKGVFISNIPLAAEIHDLERLFQSCGPILNIKIVRDKQTGRSKQYAFVNFKTFDAVPQALQLDGQMMNANRVRVCRLKEPHKHEKQNHWENDKLKTKVQKSEKRKSEDENSSGREVADGEVVSDNPKKKKKSDFLPSENVEVNEIAFEEIKRESPEKTPQKINSSDYINFENES